MREKYSLPQGDHLSILFTLSLLGREALPVFFPERGKKKRILKYNHYISQYYQLLKIAKQDSDSLVKTTHPLEYKQEMLSEISAVSPFSLPVSLHLESLKPSTGHLNSSQFQT